ncbi:hypothetical protein EBZ80_01315 [bacterium]|nr:hypothetical protein [bacterium]
MKYLWDAYGWHIILFGGLAVLLVLGITNLLRGRMGTTGSTWGKIFEALWMPSPSSSPPRFGTLPPSRPQGSSKGEARCREFLEFTFGKRFEKTRPSFLINPVTNQTLELDCYNEDLRLAVEYNGEQHYRFNKMMHQNSRDGFRNLQYRDHVKKELCERYGIHLIVVPYTVSEDDIPSFLYARLKAAGYIHPSLVLSSVSS